MVRQGAHIVKEILLPSDSSKNLLACLKNNLIALQEIVLTNVDKQNHLEDNIS
jgi:hypothetical protein